MLKKILRISVAVACGVAIVGCSNNTPVGITPSASTPSASLFSPGTAFDIAIGYNGSIWKLDKTAITGLLDHQVYKWCDCHGWRMSNGGGVRIDVDPNGRPWIVNSSGDVYTKDYDNVDTRFFKVGTGMSDIGCGADGSVWALGKDPFFQSGDHKIFKWNGSSFDWSESGGAVRIDATNDGRPVVVNKAGAVYRGYSNMLHTRFEQIPLGVGIDVCGGYVDIKDPNDGNDYGNAGVYILGNNGHIYTYEWANATIGRWKWNCLSTNLSPASSFSVLDWPESNLYKIVAVEAGTGNVRF